MKKIQPYPAVLRRAPEPVHKAATPSPEGPSTQVGPEPMTPKPSELPRFLMEAVPYSNTFGRVEREIGAALYVEACRANGDTWQPVDPPMMGAAIRALATLDPIPSWISFMGIFRLIPDIQGLCKEGFFTKSEEHGPITPTDLFFERVARWVTRRGEVL